MYSILGPLNEKGGKETEVILTASRGDIELMQIDIAGIQKWRIRGLTSSMQMQPPESCASLEA